MTNNKFTVKSAAASIAGMGVGAYAGFNLLVPGIGAAGIWYLGRFVKPKQPVFLAALALLAGHWMWLLVGTALLGAWQDNGLDIAAMLALAAWLWLRPGLSAVVSLTIFEAVAVLLNGAVIADQAPGSVMHRALFLHIVLRCLTVFLAWQAYRTWRSASDV
ncbi:MAG: hypothetical protein K0S57_3522 [Ramlibacter sp.]|jgi:hypothetical protein|nr:hypothetical protein [Ramlibacter sp.]